MAHPTLATTAVWLRAGALVTVLLGGCPDHRGGVRDSRPSRQPEPTASRPDGAARADQRTTAPRPATPERLRAERAEADRLSRALLEGGVAAREVASVCDIRGYRLYRRQRFARARVWFDLAVKLDPTFEPALYNAARVAAKVGDVAAARRRLAQLRRLDTPLGRRQLQRAAKDPDLAPAR